MIPRLLAISLLAAVLVAACTKTDNDDIDGQPDVTDDPAGEDVETEVPDTLDAPETIDTSDPIDEDGIVDTIGLPCATEEDCQNGLYCDGVEECPFGFCRAGPLRDCSDTLDCTLDTCDEETDTCEHTVDDAACDDSNPCTTDTCDVSTDTCSNEEIDCADTINCTLDTCDVSTGDCEHTIADEACNDLDDCTIDTCDVSSDTCANTLIDGDGDLHPPESCGGDDCDDTDDTIYTGATEICSDGIDQDCDGFDEAPGSCDCPYDITLDSVTDGDTTGLPATYAGTCDIFGMSGSEAAHRLVLSSSTTVAMDQYSDIMLGILFVKQTDCTGTEVMCADYTTGAEATLTAGTYIVFVDDVLAGISGPYTLVVREVVTPTAVTGNDACSGAHAITADGSWGGANSSLTNQGDGTCATTPGGLEAWFTFTLGSSTDVHIDTFGSDYDTTLFLREGSCTGTEAGCDEDAGFRTESALDLTLAAGTYYLAVDGNDSTATGNYQLNVMGLP